jgi:hypothetical protein
MTDRPNITTAQILAVLTFVVTQVVAWGWVDNDNGQKFLSIGGIVIPAVWKLADAYLRGKRNEAAAVAAATVVNSVSSEVTDAAPVNTPV